MGISWLALTTRQVGEPAEVGLEAPDPLVGGEHRVVVGRRVLVVDRVAVDRHPVAGLPVAHRRPDAQHDAGGVGADDVVRQGVAGGPRALAGVAVEEAERRQRLEDRRPHRVEVDARRHHGDVGLVGRQLGRGDVADVQALGRVLLGRLDPGEHVGVLAPHEGGAVVVGQGEVGAARRRSPPPRWPPGSAASPRGYRRVAVAPKPRTSLAPCQVPTSSPAPGPRSGRCPAPSPRSPPPTSAASPSRPRSSGPAWRPTRSTTSSWARC